MKNVKHNKFDYIMDCLFTDITSIDFNAFSMQDIDDLLKHVYSIPIMMDSMILDKL